MDEHQEDHSQSQSQSQDPLPPSTPEEQTPSPTLAPLTPASTPKKASTRSKKRQSTETKTPPAKRTTVKPSSGISEDDARLISLKNEGKSWKEISNIFKEEGRGTVKPDSLSKRYSRLGIKHIVWEDNEVEVLLQAIAEVEKKKWENVSLKMVELGEGNVKKFVATACEKKAKELMKAEAEKVADSK